MLSLLPTSQRRLPCLSAACARMAFFVRARAHELRGAGLVAVHAPQNPPFALSHF